MRIEFPGSLGHPLAANLDLPAGTPRAYALFAHCFTCSKDSLAAARISRALATEGIAVLRFDFTGLGGSDGDFANTDFSSNIDDLVAAAEYLGEQHSAPSLLIGHSLGGAAVIAAASRIPSARAVVSIAAPSAPEHVTARFAGASAEILKEGEAEVELAGRTFRIRRELLEDLATQPQRERITALDAALLVMHSPDDNSVGLDNAREIFEAARHPKSFVSIDGADHLLTGRADAAFAASMIAAWSERYAFDPGTLPGEQEAVEDTNTTVVYENGRGRFAQTALAGGHTLTADEPVPIGDNTGPSPYDYLLTGLGACTSMTLRMYADRKKIPLEGVSVSLRHSRVHAEDCADCEAPGARMERIEREITLEGPLDAGQREALLRIADKCPVHRTLARPVEIRTSERMLPAQG